MSHRLLPMRHAPGTVDREAGVIYGASAMQAVEALGHGLDIDETTLAAVAELGNGRERGVKVRFTHPGMCDDGMGKLLGRMSNFEVREDRVIGDIHLSDSAANSPSGDLRGYVLDLAEEEPDLFGMSVVVAGDAVWQLDNGAEVPDEGQRPNNATHDLPLLRPTKLAAVDIVDEPAANRDGLFSEHGGLEAVHAFARLDAMRESLGLSLEQSATFLTRYFTERGIALRLPSSPQEAPAMLDAEQLQALAAAQPEHAARIVALAAEGMDSDAISVTLASEAVEAELCELRSLRDSNAEQIESLTAARDEALAAADSVKVELAEAQARIEELEAFKAGAAVDPGPDGNGMGTSATRKSQMNAKQVAAYIEEHGKGAYRALPK